MSGETRKVLEMLAEGRISAQEAEKIFDGLGASPVTQVPPGEKSEGVSSKGTKRLGSMRILVEKPGHNPVNIRMPFSFTRSGTKLLDVLTPQVSKRLAALGIDLSSLGAMRDLWTDSIENAGIEIDKGDGRKVRIFLE